MMDLLPYEAAPAHILSDETCEFVWRQPVNFEELALCLYAVSKDPVASYHFDGNDHWTAKTVSEWWQRRGELLEWIDAWSRRKLARRERNALRQYERFLREGCELYLRSYVFLLNEGKAAQPEQKLPMV